MTINPDLLKRIENAVVLECDAEAPDLEEINQFMSDLVSKRLEKTSAREKSIIAPPL